ncbi:MAG: DEAD/DEAH box helicase family protein, partial [Eubacteriales bacterium]|nr:DEAD/DEAH box helicase family protein [Eubacteriales bacterium]
EKGERYARSAFQAGMLTRFLLSVLIDADRWDSACFEYGRDSMKQSNPVPDWAQLSKRYEAYAKETFTGTGELDRKRQEISDLCVEKADGRTGIYRLSVPTGGGKTFASLRYAMKHAKQNGQQHIFYIIPYNTILDQNAKDIREALAQYEGILEHHSNVMVMQEDDKEEELLRYKQLTERWDSDIILTSMVQFLNALFRKENTNARRMHRLTNAVLIFDEIQALPRHCKGLFERRLPF